MYADGCKALNSCTCVILLFDRATVPAGSMLHDWHTYSRTLTYVINPYNQQQMLNYILSQQGHNAHW